MSQLRGKVSWLLLLQLCCLLASSAALNCSNHHELLTAQTKCFQDQGINFTVPKLAGAGKGFEARNVWMEAVIIQKGPEFCLRQKEFQAAVECDIRISIGCIPKGNQENLPDQKVLQLLVPAICDDAKKVNFPCAKSKIKSMMACGAPKSLPDLENVENAKAAHEMMCKLFEENHACQIGIIMECGCNTVRVLDMILREIINPLTCPPMAGGPVSCDPAKVGYMASDGIPLVHHFACSMFISILFFAVELAA